MGIPPACWGSWRNSEAYPLLREKPLLPVKLPGCSNSTTAYSAALCTATPTPVPKSHPRERCVAQIPPFTVAAESVPGHLKWTDSFGKCCGPFWSHSYHKAFLYHAQGEMSQGTEEAEAVGTEDFDSSAHQVQSCHFYLFLMFLVHIA